MLSGRIKESVIQEAYANSIRFLSKNIEDYYNAVTDKFNRALASQDGLKEEDIVEYSNSVEYIQSVQLPLGPHLELGLVTPAALIQNVTIELEKGRQCLENINLDSHLIETHLGNLCMLKSTFQEFESNYIDSCK
ncbi:unnamed protein product, partial [Rotaria sp. Silwood2]